MTNEPPTPPGFLRTVALLLDAARKRAAGRRRRQDELFHQRSAKPSTDWSGFGFALLAIFMPLLSIGAAFAVSMAVDSAQCFEAERGGKIVVSSSFVSIVRGRSARELTAAERDLASFYSSEADRIVERYGGKRAAI
jgi:hypothetical protein